MGRWNSRRRSGTDSAGEPWPDPFVDCVLFPQMASWGVSVIVSRSTVGDCRLYDVTAGPDVLVDSVIAQAIELPFGQFFGTFELLEGHNYKARVKFQFYPEHESNVIP